METDATVTPGADAGRGVVPMSWGVRIVLGLVRMVSFVCAVLLALAVGFILLLWIGMLPADERGKFFGTAGLWLLVGAMVAYLVGLMAVMFGGERRWPWVAPGALAMLWVFRDLWSGGYVPVALPLLGSMLLVAVQVALTWTPRGWRTWQGTR